VEASRKDIGVQWSLLQVREGNYKRAQWGQVEAESRERLSLFQVLLKFNLTYGKGRTW
jgi:hypothetical protein